MSNIFTKIWKKRWVLRSLLSTIYFNFHYLSFRQAIKLPILLRKPHFEALKGSVSIKGPVRFGMIELGSRGVSLYPDSGIVFENHGGEIVFNGPCTIGNSSAISVGRNGKLEIGNNVIANAAIKIIAYHHIAIGDNCRLAWETMAMDTDFHALTRPDGSKSKGFGPVSIGHNCWIGTGCLLLKNTSLPPYTTVQARTILNKKYDIPEKSVLGTKSEVVVKASDTYRDLNNDTVDF